MSDLINKEKIPYICAPLTGKSRHELLEELKAILTLKPDLIEWRVDFLEEDIKEDYILSIIDDITSNTKTPLIVTIRSEQEGGNPISLSDKQIVELLKAVCKKSAASFIDFELFNDEKYITSLRETATRTYKKLILSYHNFTFTPTNEELLAKVEQAKQYGADVAKIAVMPKTKDDVLRLLQVTNNVYEEKNIPLISMSMGQLGKISRVVGWEYGSIVTFGAGIQASAPGQIDIQTLRNLIDNTKVALSK